MKKLTIVLSAVAFSFIAACGPKDSTDNTDARASKRIDYHVDHQATLLRALPSNAVVYSRYPSLVNMITTPSEDALYPALENSAMQTQTASILEGIDKNLLSKIQDPQMRELISLFVNKQTAPLEMAVLAASSVTPELILHTKINVADMSELKSLLEQIVAASQNQLQLTDGPDAEGNFEIATGPFPAYGYFDLNNKDFVVYGGPTALKRNLTEYRAGKLEKRNDLKEFEAQFDASGTGFAFWADTDKLWSQLSALIPLNIKPEVDKLNLEGTKFVYMGSASKSGHSSMRLHIQYKEDSDNLLYFSTSQTALDAQVAMPLNFTATVPMPNQQHLAQLIKLDNQLSVSPSLNASIVEMTEQLKTEYELDFNQLISAFGSSATVVGDKAGTWVSLPIQNTEAFDNLIEITQKKLGATLTKTNASGVEIAHYTFPGLTKLALEAAEEDIKSEMTEPLMQLLSAENIHLYWVREGDNLIIASLPQILIARERHKSNTTVSMWAKSRDINRGESILSMTANVEDLPKTAYHMYLAGVQTLSDIAGVEPNLIAMPLAEDLGLADNGRLGMALNTGKTSTSLIFDYEYTPLDYLSGGNTMATVAVVGVLAAVALPAYKDYTVRARGSEALLLASQMKVELSEYYSQNNAFPTEKNSTQFAIETDSATIYYDAEVGVIKIFYAPGIDDRLTDTEINLIPSVSEAGYVEWVCSNVSAPIALIPPSCRN